MGGRDRTLFAASWAPRDPRRAEVAGAWTDVQVPQRRVDWCSPCAFCTKSHHERATMTHPQWHEGRRWSEKWAMGEHSDCFVVACGSLWMSGIDVEYQNACFKVEHDLFCTNQPSVIGVRCVDCL